MTEQQALDKMIAPGTPRPGKWRRGVIQVWVTRACDKACYGCTQGSNLRGPYQHITVEQFAAAIESLRGYFGVVGMFGGNPAIHPNFAELCAVLRDSWVPKVQRGLWCNNPISFANAEVMRETFNPAVSNLNVHLDHKAYDLFKRGWPECYPVGLAQDSQHSPPYVALRDVLKTPCPDCGGTGFWGGARGGDEACETCQGSQTVYDEAQAWDLISDCDINKHWSAMIGVFRGQLRAWFCEIAGAQAMLHQGEPDYPDTGVDPTIQHNAEYDPCQWWQLGMNAFSDQVRKHCHDCGVPLRGHGALAQGDESQREQVSETHQRVYMPKRPQRPVQLVTLREELGALKTGNVVSYLENAR